MSIFKVKRTKQGSSTLTETRRTSKGTVKTSTSRSYKTANGTTVSRNLSTGKTKTRKMW
jgi:hypothetical protein